jgi:hypothetical protein
MSAPAGACCLDPDRKSLRDQIRLDWAERRFKQRRRSSGHIGIRDVTIDRLLSEGGYEYTVVMIAAVLALTEPCRRLDWSAS